MIVALRAADRRREPHGRQVAHAVGGVARQKLLGLRATLARDQVQAVVGRGDALLLGRIVEQITRELLACELVEWLVAMERVDDPVAVRIDVPRVVGVDPGRVREPDQVEPVHRHPFGEVL